VAATRTDTVTVADGSFDLPVWLPASGSGPGLVLFQEIFGVGPYIRAVADRLAALGYVVGAPDLFWRIERNWEASHDEAGLQASMGVIQKFDFATGAADAAAAVATVRSLPEVSGARA
jgi:carboxymethylenebutenolidase